MLNQNIENLAALVRVGELAVELYRAGLAATDARDAYHARIRQYEHVFCAGQRVKFNQEDPAHSAIVEYTCEHYAKAQAARKRAYAVKQKMLRAAAKVAVLSALDKTSEASHA